MSLFRSEAFGALEVLNFLYYVSSINNITAAKVYVDIHDAKRIQVRKGEKPGYRFPTRLDDRIFDCMGEIRDERLRKSPSLIKNIR